MRIRIAGFSVSAVVLGAWFGPAVFGQQNGKFAASQDGSGEPVYDELAKAPDKARGKRNPFQKDPEAVAAGRNLFEQHCAGCHGKSAEGGKKGPNLRVAEVQNAEPGAIFWVLTNGVVRKGMPVWSKLPEPQRWQLVSYIKSMGVVPARPVSVPPANSEPHSAMGSSLPPH